MSDRLHEIIGEIGVIHKELLKDDKIFDFEYVKQFVEDRSSDVIEHYFNLLLQFYFQENDLKNLKEVLLLGHRFDMRMEDIEKAFTNIKSNDENVIEFMEENVVFLKDTNIEAPLQTMYGYYKENEELQVCLEQTIELIKRNRYVCAYAYKNSEYEFAKFFLNEDLLESLKRDLPHLLK